MLERRESIVIIGGGFAGLAAACYLAKGGFRVTVLEKNGSLGGRARSFIEAGFTFDMGPSWYWMPDIFEQFFADFGYLVDDFYQLKRLDPSYRVFWSSSDFWDLPAGAEAVARIFEEAEPGAASKLEKFLRDASKKYQAGMYDYAQRPCLSLSEFLDMGMLKECLTMNLFGSYGRYVERMFDHPRIRQLLEFPVLFLGATAPKTPAMYSLMAYADIALGTWYPEGGMLRIVAAMEKLARSLGVQIRTNSEVVQVLCESGSNGPSVKSVVLDSGEQLFADILLGSADYHHIETTLLPADYRSYSTNYWDKRVLAPSCVLFYLGVDTKVPGLLHHNLLFDEDFGLHAREIYETKQWPTRPHTYVCVPSKSDPHAAPMGSENIFVLIPVATGLKDDPARIEHYREIVLDKLKSISGIDLRPHLVVERAYSGKDFISDYHSFKGNAYGLANTLAQTAMLKPRIKSKKLRNLYFAGQLTVPGPGVPPSLLSGKIVAELISRDFGEGQSIAAAPSH